MSDRKNNIFINIIPSVVLCIIFNLVTAAQTSEFTYQGKLSDSVGTANGQYDLKFKLYDSSNAQIGSEIAKEDVQVANGFFTVTLDFGANAFDGSARSLEMLVRPGASTGSFTTLAPRLPISSAPYAIRSAKALTSDTATNATQLGGVNASQYVQTSDARLTDAREPLPDSPNYIQNTQTTQAASNFNISGNGTLGGTLTANSVSVNAGGLILNDNLLRLRSAADPNHGMIWSPVVDGPEFRSFSGFRWQSGSGVLTERMRLDGAGNLTVGGGVSAATQFNIGGVHILSNLGNGNLRVGFGAGRNLVNGSTFSNTMIGTAAGSGTTTGYSNVFVGNLAGNGLCFECGNTTGDGNTVIGTEATVSSPDLSNATAIGFRALVSQSNSLVLGGISGVNYGSDISVGIGTTAPGFKLHVVDPSNVGLRVQTNSAGGAVASFGDKGEFQIDAPGVGGGRFVVKENGFVGIGTTSPRTRLEVAGGLIMAPAAGGSLSICRTISNEIAFCSSSLRYKTNIADWHSGLDLLNRLRPVTFDWKESMAHDLGLVAEEVAAIEPLLVTQNDKGEIEGVKYDRVAVVLINAVKEQQAQIGNQQKLIEQQQQQIDRLQAMVRSIKYPGRRRLR